MQEFIESGKRSEVDKTFENYKLPPSLKERPNYKLFVHKGMHNVFA